MPSVYARWMDRWESRLASRDFNRVERPFEWGLEWMDLPDGEGNSVRDGVRARTAEWLADSEAFYSYERPTDFRMVDGHLTFTSPLATPYPENNRVHADLFPADQDRGRAVVVLPQWNADQQGHANLCRLLTRFGITALRMSLAYHDRRRPPETARADYHVSSNVGRTIHAARQSVIDTRACLDFLESHGYDRLGLLGTSLGSCIAFIAAAHDARVSAAALNHVSMYFGDVVWTGLSTRHVQRGLSQEVSQDELRDYWAVISPASYLDRLVDRELAVLLVWTSCDTTFLPVYSKQVVEAFRERGLQHEKLKLPCGHYTLGQFPFNIVDGLRLCYFLARKL